MLKRISGILLLAVGLGITVYGAIRIAYAIPSDFSTVGEGLDKLVYLVVRYGLRDYVPVLLLGLAMLLSAPMLFLAPRRRRVSIHASAMPSTEAEELASPAADGEADPTAIESFPSDPAVCILRTRLMGISFRGGDGVSRQSLLADIAEGDVLLCRSIADHQFPRTIGVYTVHGLLLGHLDAALTRDLCALYPGHRIGITVERISGRGGASCQCILKVGVYRT